MGHTVACAIKVLGMSAVNEIPSSVVIDTPEDVWMKDDMDRKEILRDVVSRIVDECVDLSKTFAESRPRTGQVHDGVHAYSWESLSLGFLFWNSRTALGRVIEDALRMFGNTSCCYSKRTSYSTSRAAQKVQVCQHAWPDGTFE